MLGSCVRDLSCVFGSEAVGRTPTFLVFTFTTDSSLALSLVLSQVPAMIHYYLVCLTCLEARMLQFIPSDLALVEL